MTETRLWTTTGKLLDALGAMRGGVERPHFVDRYGITYTGASGHLAIAAFLRPDITPLHGFGGDARAAVRRTAAFVGFWMNNVDTPEEHVRHFAGLPVWRVCRVLAYVLNHGVRPVLDHVGQAALPMLTEHLLEIAALDDDPTRGSFPTLEAPAGRWPGNALDYDIAVRAVDDAEYVVLHAGVEASEDVSWRFRAGVEVPAGMVHDLLTGQEHLGDYLRDNRELIKPYLDYTAAQVEGGLYVRAEIVDGEPPASVPRRPTTLYYIGTDAEHAVTGDPFLDRIEAEVAASTVESFRVFSTTVRVHATELSD